jgi:hypothetical protein
MAAAERRLIESRILRFTTTRFGMVANTTEINFDLSCDTSGASECIRSLKRLAGDRMAEYDVEEIAGA